MCFVTFPFESRAEQIISFKSAEIMENKTSTTHCGNYGNLLSHFFGKNFVKPTHLLNKLLNS